MNIYSMDIPFLLEQAQRRLSRDFDRALAEVGANAEQWRVLDRLSDEKGRPMGELATELDMNPPTMTKLIDRMVAGGLAQRIVDETDNRRVLVFITDAGLVLLERLSERAAAFHNGLAHTLTKKEAAQLGRLLSSITSRPA